MINNILQTWAVFLRICRKVQMQQQGKSTFLKTCAKIACSARWSDGLFLQRNCIASVSIKETFAW